MSPPKKPKQQPNIQEILTSAQSQREKLQLSKQGLLIDSLQRATKSLSKNYMYDNPFNPTGKEDTSDYFKMFEAVSEKFSQLGKELLKMRSSFLPFEMYENVKSEFDDPGSKSSKKISEIIDSEAALESYENTFFRLLGMPSTADIRDDSLITVTKSGVKRSEAEDRGFTLTAKVLDKRALSISDRLDHPGSSSYDFLSNTPSLERLSHLGFSKPNLAALSEILVKLHELQRPSTGRDEESVKLASSLISLMNKVKNVSQEDSKYQEQELNQLRVIYGPDAPPNSPSPSYLLNRALDIALEWLEPTVSGKINSNLKDHLVLEHIVREPKATMENLNTKSNFWRYSYLLFPPVQDGRVATCINEPSKMVAEPFLPESMRVVNGHKLKSTLLEAVIRIRLDVISGFVVSGPKLNKSGMASSTDGDERSITPNEMGLLESLLIVRLFSALHGFAKDVAKKVEAAKKAQIKAKRAPSGNPKSESDHTPAPLDQKYKSKTQLELESMLLVEESLLLLFGDGSIPEALSAQAGVARNSGVKTAHLMGAALSVLDVPKRWAEQELGKLTEVESRSAEKEGAHATGSLRVSMGVAKGVGSVDMLAFLIALFTAKEEVLLGLLTDKQFEYLKAEYPKGFFDDYKRNEWDTGAAVNRIASRAFDAYQLFNFMLTPTGRAPSAVVSRKK
jgi:hypothetical protein